MESKNLETLRIFITGGCGFIGSHLVKRCEELGARVSVLKEPKDSCQRLHEMQDKIEMFECSLADTATLKKIVTKLQPQIVFHLAARLFHTHSLDQFDELYNVNVLGTKSLLDILLKNSEVQRFLYVGTGEEYGSGPIPFQESQPGSPVSLYSLCKLMATKMVEYAALYESFPGVILRLAVVYGPAQDTHMFIPSLIRSCIEKKDFPMTQGEQTRDFLFVEDVIEGLILAAKTPGIEGEIINLGSGKELSIKEVAQHINNVMGNPIKLDRGAKPYRSPEIMRYCLNIEKAKTLLGWEPEVSFQEGLKRTIDWYKRQ